MASFKKQAQTDNKTALFRTLSEVEELFMKGGGKARSFLTDKPLS